MVKRSLQERLRRLDEELGPPLPVCELCGRRGGCSVRTAVEQADGTLRYRDGKPPPCEGCMRVNAMLGRPGRTIIHRNVRPEHEGDPVTPMFVDRRRGV